jgi:hypothetical protein
MRDGISLRTIVPPSFMRAAIALAGPGWLGRDGAASLMIFDAGEDCRSRDMVARFFGEEIDALQWVEDYLADRDMLNMMARLEELPFGEEEEEEEVYDRKAVVTTESDSGWADV